VPAQFDLEAAAAKYPVRYENSFNNFLIQEMERFNRLLEVIRASLEAVQQAVQGLVLMSRGYEELITSLLTG
jgi:dynein heavy chain